MKTFEIVAGILFVIALNIASFSGGTFWATISLTSLAFLYCPLGLVYFNKIEPNKFFSRKSYADISKWQILGTIAAGWALSVTCIGILFKIKDWPGAMNVLLTGLISLLVVAIVIIVNLFIAKKNIYESLLMRIVFFGGIGLFLII